MSENKGLLLTLLDFAKLSEVFPAHPLGLGYYITCVSKLCNLPLEAFLPVHYIHVFQEIILFSLFFFLFFWETKRNLSIFCHFLFNNIKDQPHLQIKL